MPKKTWRLVRIPTTMMSTANATWILASMMVATYKVMAATFIAVDWSLKKRSPLIAPTNCPRSSSVSRSQHNPFFSIQSPISFHSHSKLVSVGSLFLSRLLLHASFFAATKTRPNILVSSVSLQNIYNSISKGPTVAMQFERLTLDRQG